MSRAEGSVFAVHCVSSTSKFQLIGSAQIRTRDDWVRSSNAISVLSSSQNFLKVTLSSNNFNSLEIFY